MHLAAGFSSGPFPCVAQPAANAWSPWRLSQGPRTLTQTTEPLTCRPTSPTLGTGGLTSTESYLQQCLLWAAPLSPQTSPGRGRAILPDGSSPSGDIFPGGAAAPSGQGQYPEASRRATLKPLPGEAFPTGNEMTLLIEIRDPQTWHRGHFGQDNPLFGGGGCPVSCGMFRGIPGLHPPDAGSPPQL